MKEKEINLPSLRRFKSSRLCFFSPLKILQVTELAADVSSLKHELRSSSMQTLSILLKGPAAKQGDEKLVYRLIQLFPSTEIFSKRRKICALWRKTRVICKRDVKAVCRGWLAHASGVHIYPLCACAPSSKICESLEVIRNIVNIGVQTQAVSDNW